MKLLQEYLDKEISFQNTKLIAQHQQNNRLFILVYKYQN